MHIHYLSCHSVLEYLEVSLFTEMGHEVFSNGAYLDPKGNYMLHRPGIDGATHYPEYARLATENPKTALPPELIEPFDVIISMHQPEIVVENWPRIKHKKVIFRSIGQNTPEEERILKPLRDQGLKIIRYSPKENNIPDFAGSDGMARFYLDSEEFQGWTGSTDEVINVTQSLRARGKDCRHDIIMQTMTGFNAKIYGPGNDNLGGMNGGQLQYELQKGKLRDARVFVYGGTWPASYTLSFMEAFMTGLPIVSIGKKLFSQGFPDWDLFEVPEIMDHGQMGFVGETVEEMRSYITQLINDGDMAREISQKARNRAKEFFDKQVVRRQWTDILKKL